MRFHPVISIFLGVITSFVLYLIIPPLFVNVWFDAFIIIFSYLIGGFIAVFYAREKKIQYALYEGILMMLIIALLALGTSSDVSIIAILFYSVLIIVLAVIGGIIGLIIDKNYRKSFKSKYWNKGFSFVSIITGVLFIFVIWVFTILITYTIIPATNIIILKINLINTTELIAISVIGGFMSTYIGKEKQLLNGIFIGLAIILISIVVNAYAIIQGHPNPYFFSPLISIIATLGYILAPTLGSYLAIIATEYQQINNE